MTPIEQAMELLQEAADKERGKERDSPRIHRRTSRRHRNPFRGEDKETEVRLRTLEAMEEMVSLMRHITGPVPPVFPNTLGYNVPGDIDAESASPKPSTPGECPKDRMVAASQFEYDLKSLINKYSLENETNVPGFILASYLVRCLEAFRHTVQHTHNWYEGSTWSNPYGPTDSSDTTVQAYDKK